MANLKTQWTNAWESALTAELSAGSTTITVGDASRLSTPCYLVIDPENDAAREYVLVTFISGNNLTVTRYQADSAQLSGLTHAAGTIIRTSAVAQGFTDLHDRIDALGDHGVQEGLNDDDHPQYLNNTRHQADAAHPVGTVIKAGTPGSSAPGDTAAAGTAVTVARSDHRHGREAAAAFAGAKLQHSVAYNIDTMDFRLLTWDTEIFDTHGFHSAANPERLTVPAGMGGYYLLTGWMFVGGDAAGADNDTATRIHMLRKNGVDPGGRLASTYDRPPAAQIVGSTGVVTTTVLLAAGDYIEYLLQVSHVSATASVNNAANYLGGFEIVRLGS